MRTIQDTVTYRSHQKWSKKETAAQTIYWIKDAVEYRSYHVSPLTQCSLQVT